MSIARHTSGVAVAALIALAGCAGPNGQMGTGPATTPSAVAAPVPSGPIQQAPAGSPVARHGALSVRGNAIVDATGQPVTLRGMSLFWSQWAPQYYSADTVDWLAQDWKVDVVRAAIAAEGDDGARQHFDREFAKASTVIDAAVRNGLYVVVDWHAHRAYPEEAKRFLTAIARKYGTLPNLIYEDWNEPLRDGVDWSRDVKPYHMDVIGAIRQTDPDNLVIAGSPSWSQDVDIAARDPLPFTNVAYTLHYYAASHGQPLRDKADVALKAGLPLMITEFGTVEATGNGPIDRPESDQWWAWAEKNHISWMNWSIADKDETSAALKPGTAPSGWAADRLTASGTLLRDRLRAAADARAPVRSVDLTATFAPAAHAVASTGPTLRLGKCINLSNMLEAPTEGAWGRRFEDADIGRIAGKGFSAIRLPARFGSHALAGPPYTVEPAFMDRVAHIVDLATARGLKIIVDFHHYDELTDDPAAHAQRFAAIWGQVAQRFANAPDTVSFEILNEPKDKLGAANLLAVLNPALAEIRRTNPRRIVVVDGPEWAGLDAMLTSPFPDDPYVVPTFHYYSPVNFGFPVAEWLVPPSRDDFGRPEDLELFRRDLDKVRRYIARTGRVPFVGEYGAFEGRPLAEREEFYETLSEMFASIGVDSCAWGYTNTMDLWTSGKGGWQGRIADRIAAPLP